MDEQGLGSASVTQAPGFTRWMLDYKDPTTHLDLLLQGARLELSDDSIPVLIVDENSKEIVNEYGRKIIVSALAANSHVGITLSNLSERRISAIIEELHKSIGHKLLAEWERIGVETPDDVPRIVMTYLTPSLYAVMRRSADGMTVKQINKMQQETVVVQKKDTGGGMFKMGGDK